MRNQPTSGGLLCMRTLDSDQGVLLAFLFVLALVAALATTGCTCERLSGPAQDVSLDARKVATAADDLASIATLTTEARVAAGKLRKAAGSLANSAELLGLVATGEGESTKGIAAAERQRGP
jgi:hypothetical protein